MYSICSVLPPKTWFYLSRHLQPSFTLTSSFLSFFGVYFGISLYFIFNLDFTVIACDVGKALFLVPSLYKGGNFEVFFFLFAPFCVPF